MIFPLHTTNFTGSIILLSHSSLTIEIRSSVSELSINVVLSLLNTMPHFLFLTNFISGELETA